MALILFAKEETHLTGRMVVFSPENEFLFIEDKVVSFTYTKKIVSVLYGLKNEVTCRVI
jgi:hypothetical protein